MLRGIIFWFVVASLSFIGCTAAAKDLWVDRESRGGPCSDSRTRDEIDVDSPWCSLAHSGVQAQPGDEVYVRGGTYTEVQTCGSCNDNAVLQVVASGRQNAWIRYSAYQQEHVRIEPRGAARHGIVVRETYDGIVPGFIAFEGFEIANAQGNCIVAKRVSDVVFRDLDIHGCRSGSVEFHETTRITLEYSLIHDNPLGGWTSAIDLYLCGAGHVIRGNYVWANTDTDSRESEGHGLTMDYCRQNGGALIENNVIWDNEGWCMAVYVSDGGTIRNNTCWRNGRRGNGTGEISLLGSHHRVHNNILVPRSGVLALNIRDQNAAWTSDWSTIEEDHNILWSPNHDQVIGWGNNWAHTVDHYRTNNSQGWGQHTLQVDPRLIDPGLSAAGNVDFRVASGSPAMDSGNPTQAAQVDADYHPRPLDGDGDGIAVVDRGAYEAPASQTPVVTAPAAPTNLRVIVQ